MGLLSLPQSENHAEREAFGVAGGNHGKSDGRPLHSVAEKVLPAAAEALGELCELQRKYFESN